jgi:hypothetical protein
VKLIAIFGKFIFWLQVADFGFVVVFLVRVFGVLGLDM